VAEANQQLKALYRAGTLYYNRAFPHPKKTKFRCLPKPAGPAPAKSSPEPVEVDFFADSTPGAESWRALGFNPSEPLRYRYSFFTEMAGCELDPVSGTPLFRVIAEGDLDSDGQFSLFERSAVLDKNGQVIPGPLLTVENRVE
jgi:hypothetical protein